jgi:ABC-type multidrug transport system fused ATPase/permease subunit
MTENSEELAELQRAHAALESKVTTILPTLATKADLESMGRHLTDEMTRRFETMNQRFDQQNQRFDQQNQRFDQLSLRFDERFDALQKAMTDGFNRLWLWIAGTLVAVIVAILGSSWFAPARQAPAAPPVVYQLYPPGYTALPAPPVAPSPQP